MRAARQVDIFFWLILLNFTSFSFLSILIIIDLPQYPNVDPFNYDTMKNALLERFESFHSAPFTIQRLAELITNPRKQYSRIDKFMRAIEKNILGNFLFVHINFFFLYYLI